MKRVLIFYDYDDKCYVALKRRQDINGKNRDTLEILLLNLQGLQ